MLAVPADHASNQGDPSSGQEAEADRQDSAQQRGSRVCQLMGVDLDKWIEKLQRAEHLAEDELKALCEYVSTAAALVVL